MTRLVAALVVVAAARIAAADPAVGFDHIVHEGKVSVWVSPAGVGHDPIACTACHRISAGGGVLGRPDHGACLGACHAAPPRGVAPSAEQRVICTACHASADLDGGRPRVAYPPYRLDPDYGLTISHAAHAAEPCTTCHAVPGRRTRAPVAPGPRTAPLATGRGAASAPHARCVACHAARVAPRMSACTDCHLQAYGANARPRLERGPLATGAAFSHLRHAGRGNGGGECGGCHRGIVTAAGLELPPPATADCATGGCHDGAAAFPTTATCTRCHTQAPAEAFVVKRPSARFSHDDHAAWLPIDGCATCHQLDRGGQPVAASHAACTGCHAADFAARAPTTCGACHVTTEPWRRLRADQLPAPASDFGVELPHADHTSIACTSCHQLTTATRELRPPRGHAACTGGACHAAAGGPAPPLTACAACHQRGLELRREHEGTARPWSVRARFRHGTHARDPRTAAPLACVACHADVTTAAALAALTPPTKPTCASCHDGTTAFKVTGHACARCHGR